MMNIKTFIYLTFFINSLAAKYVDVESAVTLAEKFINSNSIINTQIKSIDIYKKDGIDIFHYVNLEPKGFILISADDRIKPVLGYSFKNEFKIDNMPQNLKWLLDKYVTSIVTQKNNLDEQTLNIQESWKNFESEHINNSSRNVDPLLEAEFNQAPPGWIDLLDPFDWINWDWNEECPEDDDGPGNHAVVGCVAVAMSQVMHYWQFPEYGSGAHEYDADEYGNLYVDFENTFYDFENMSSTSSDSQNKVLLYHSGVSVNMNYGSDVSGAWVCDENSWSGSASEAALKDFFRYDEDLHCIEPEDFDNDEEYQNKLIDELDNERPIIYVGVDEESSSGHAWNIDGYFEQSNGDLMFHCNWGWGGSSNGWFYLNDLDPGLLSPNFSDSQRALIGIQPQTGCLDEEAFNYTSEPVLPCDDCCDYCQNDGLIDISIVPDEYPEYISWELWYKGKYVLSSQYMYPTLIASGNFNGENICVTEQGMYEFIIYDSEGNGLSGTSSDEGFYEVTLNGDIVAGGATFGYQESTMFAWLDSDGDLVIDSIDECEGYDDNLDSDFDNIADGCDICPNDSDNDIDQDGICGDIDVCPNDPLNDDEEDGVCYGIDNCPYLYNPSQSNYDNDVQGDTCDLDDDNDGVGDINDCNPFNGEIYDYDCCSVCGGDNSSCGTCCGLPFNYDCSDDCYIDYNGGCCYEDDIDCSGECQGDAQIDICDVCGGDGFSCTLLGDLNSDGSINVVDLVSLIDIILNIEYNWLGDLNHDEICNVIDAVSLVDWLLYGIPSPNGTWKAIMRIEENLNTGAIDSIMYTWDTILGFNNGEWNSSVSYENIDFYGFENAALEFTRDSLFLNPSLSINGWNSVVDYSQDEIECSEHITSDNYLRAKYYRNDNSMMLYYNSDSKYIELILTNDFDIEIVGCTNPYYLNFNPLANQDNGFCNNIECSRLLNAKPFSFDLE